MKTFTFLFTFLVITALVNAQDRQILYQKIQQKQEKISAITQLSAKFKSHTSFNSTKMNLKSAAATQKLDSTLNRVFNVETQLWQNDYKDEYLYDAEMNNTVSVNKEWNLATNTWGIVSKTELEYDNNDRINAMLMYENDEFTQELKQVSKFLIYYDSEGMQDSISMSSSEDDGITWVLDMKQINHYNEAKQLIKTDFWVWDEDLGELMLSMNIVNTYTASGRINTVSMTVIDEGDEMLWSITEYNYDGSEKLTSIEYSALSFFTFTLEKSSRITYQYNASGGRTVEINSAWNGTSWDDEDKTEYEYNAAGDVSVEIYSTWDGNTWIEEEKDVYTFSTTNFSDVAFPQIDFITEIFSSFLNLFGLQVSFDFSYIKVITGVKSFYMLNENWVNTEETFFYYSSGTSTNINEFENSIVSVYPNPASESVTFRWKNNYNYLTLEIYQITGAQVLKQTAFSDKSVSVSQLENGVYFYKLQDGNQTIYSGKLIKK